MSTTATDTASPKAGGVTEREFRTVLSRCRDLYARKLHDYGTAWRIMRPPSLTDQLYIKAARIRSLQLKGKAMVPEDETAEFVGIVNYSIIALIQLRLGPASGEDLNVDEALEAYDREAAGALALMIRKNHDYDEAWRAMRVSSLADLILMKVFRTKQIEDLAGKTLVSEGVGANYMDMLNYAVFALIHLGYASVGDESVGDRPQAV